MLVFLLEARLINVPACECVHVCACKCKLHSLLKEKMRIRESQLSSHKLTIEDGELFSSLNCSAPWAGPLKLGRTDQLVMSAMGTEYRHIGTTAPVPFNHTYTNSHREGTNSNRSKRIQT